MALLAQFGRSALAPFASVATWYTKSAIKYPLATGMITTGVKTGAADLFAQKVLEGKEELDVKRHLAFWAFGFGYLGGFQYWLYNVKFTQWCGPISSRFGHKAAMPIKVFIDQCIHHPLVYFPVFYSLKASIEGKPLSSAVKKYKNEIWDNLKNLWMVWVPAQAVNFTVIPRHFRIPFVAAVSFGWTVILSVTQSQFDTSALKLTAPSPAAAVLSTPSAPPAKPPIATGLSPEVAAGLAKLVAASKSEEAAKGEETPPKTPPSS